MRVRPLAAVLVGLLTAVTLVPTAQAAGPQGVDETEGCKPNGDKREFVLVSEQGRTRCYSGLGLTRPNSSGFNSWHAGRYHGYLRYQDEGIAVFVRFVPKESGRLDPVSKVLEIRLEQD